MVATDNLDSLYAVYLIPPYSISCQVASIHHVLRKQFGLVAADRFQVHATIKGFFRKLPGPLGPLIQGLDEVFSRQKPLRIHFAGLRIDPVGFGLDISTRGGQPNEELLTLREQVVDVIEPFIAPDCDFSSRELSAPFRAHITLAFRDIPPHLYDDVLAYVGLMPLPCQPFVADTFHCLQFFSEDWHGAWEETLSWRLLKSWTV
jgi:hypothetical protein